MTDELTIESTTHGRVLVEVPSAQASSGLIVAFHGYAQRAEDALSDVQTIPGASGWRIAAVQALHRFYARDQKTVVASWMTRQDRDVAIADNVEYIDRTIDRLIAQSLASAIVFAGFSQGASMAYRAAVLGRRRAAGVIALAGDIPPDLRERRTGSTEWPPVLIGAGHCDQWYTEDKLNTDVAFLQSRSIPHAICRFAGGHEWTDEFREAAGRWLGAL